MKNGCTEYTTGTLKISFPGDHPTCAMCPLLEWRHGIRHQCEFTGEIIPYPKEDIGQLCPIEFSKEDNA